MRGITPCVCTYVCVCSDGTSAKTNPAWEVPVDFGRLEDVYERVVKNMSQKIGLVKGDDAMIGYAIYSLTSSGNLSVRLSVWF